MEGFENEEDEDPLRRSEEEGALFDTRCARVGARTSTGASRLAPHAERLLRRPDADPRPQLRAVGPDAAARGVPDAPQSLREAPGVRRGLSDDGALLRSRARGRWHVRPLLALGLPELHAGAYGRRARSPYPRACSRTIDIAAASRLRPRILSLAAGPAIELRHLFDSDRPLPRPVELILLDQDLLAHETAYRRLTRLLSEKRPGALPITLTCLHFSVRQLLKPQTSEEQQYVVRVSVLANLDLVYLGRPPTTTCRARRRTPHADALRPACVRAAAC